MKKYKIGNKFIVADSAIRAIKIAKIFDSIKDNEEIDYLTKEEEQAVEDYRKAIAGTANPKLLELYKHILDEELEHIRELEQANNNVEDSYTSTTVTDTAKYLSTWSKPYEFRFESISELDKFYIDLKNEVTKMLTEGYSIQKSFWQKRLKDSKIKDWAPPYAIWVKKDGKWIIFGGSNSTNVDKRRFLNSGYEDVTVVENGKEPTNDSIKDERLSPMTYKKLKELGVRPEQWKKWTQEQANEYIKNKSGKNAKTSEKTTEEQTNQFDGNEDVIKAVSTLTESKPTINENGEIKFDVSPKKFKYLDELEDFLGKLGFKPFGAMDLRSGTNYLFTREVDGQKSGILVYDPDQEHQFNNKMVKNELPMTFTVNYQMKESDAHWYHRY